MVFRTYLISEHTGMMAVRGIYHDQLWAIIPDYERKTGQFL